MNTENTQEHQPVTSNGPRLIYTNEGATAFSIDDPLVKLIFTYGSFIPENDTYYGTPEQMMQGFINAVAQAGEAHPELSLQYAAWQRDPRLGKGNRSQPPWVIALLASLPECLEHPRFAELVARCIVRPDDALNIILATKKWSGDNNFPPELKRGIAQGLERMSDYQLAKYASASISLLPEKHDTNKRKALPMQKKSKKALEKLPEEAPQGKRTLRLVDVLGICKHELSPRLFALYRYLHAPTRQQAALLPILEQHLPLLEIQKKLRAFPPTGVQMVQEWTTQALQARMTVEQMFAAIGHYQPMYQLHQSGKRQTEIENAQYLSKRDRRKQKKEHISTLQPVQPEKRANLEASHIRYELWKVLLEARVPDENNEEKLIPFLGDVAFLRNVRGMYQAGVPLQTLVDETRRRSFSRIWPFQIISAARQIEQGKQRGKYEAKPCPGVLPIFDAIFEKTALPNLPRKSDGSYYRMLGLADISSSMTVQLGGKKGSATCMDAALAFSTACSYTTRTEHTGGLAGSWSDTFHAVEPNVNAQPLEITNLVRESGGWGGTQIFGSILSLTSWLKDRPQILRPEVLIIFSDMQFHPAADILPSQLGTIPKSFQQHIQRPEFRKIPPLAAALVLYREMLGADVSVVIWNLATYEGSPAPSNMKRVLLLSGFDANSFRIIEQWLQAGSPGSAMPIDTKIPAGTGESNASFEAILATLKRY